MPKHKDSTTASVENKDKPAFEDAALGFVYKSLISRDPNKRRIKPVESILSYDPALDDSESDDSDYNPTHVEDDDVEIESDGEDEKNQNGQSKVKSGKYRKGKNNGEGKHNGKPTDGSGDSSSESSDGSSDDDENDDEDDDKFDLDDNFGVDCITNNTLAKSELLLSTSSHLITNGSHSVPKTIEVDSEEAQQSRLKKILVCCVCLGDVSRNDDEIVECDSCGISVHELCYGITADDAESIHSDASSASTEPWFCDPCKAGVKTPLCELCPNTGGIFKITNVGRWIHMVCALYTHGISFTDPERLRGPVLGDIHFNRWGSKSCSLCEDDRYSITGVSAQCDAGMCRNYFHVTCAQREGLLCSHLDDVDPYIVYCKLHSDRNAAKLRRRNYLALEAKNRMLARDRQNDISIEENITNQRTLSKLHSQREKFMKHYQELGLGLGGKERRTPKLLGSSPSVLRRLSNKGQLLGFNSARNHRLGLSTITDIRRRWHIQPAFSVEFISYYIDRNDRIVSMQKQSLELIRQNKKLKDIESKIRAKYEHLVGVNEQMKTENEVYHVKIRQLLTTLGSFGKIPQEPLKLDSLHSIEEEERRIKRLNIGCTIMEKPEMHKAKPKPQTSTSGSALPFVAPGNSIYKSTSKSGKAKGYKTSIGEQSEIKIKECATCLLTKDQHMLALCDRCHMYYHLYCLDPPLRRMPKKTRFGGWQCSNCTEKDQVEEEDENPENALERAESANGSSLIAEPTNTANESNSRGGTRKLRENPKAALKYEEEVNSQLAILSSGSSNGGSALSTRGRPPRGRASAGTSSGAIGNTTSTFTGSRKRGRKPKNLSLSEISKTPADGKGRKRKLSFSQETAASIITEEASLSLLVSEPTAIQTSTLLQPTIACSTSTDSTVVPSDKSTLQSTLSETTSAAKRPLQSENCNACNKEALPKQSVRCDSCQCFYHFTCLEPPVVKSPKRRGFIWACMLCKKKNVGKREHSHAQPMKEVLEKNSLIVEPNGKVEVMNSSDRAAALTDNGPSLPETCFNVINFEEVILNKSKHKDQEESQALPPAESLDGPNENETDRCKVAQVDKNERQADSEAINSKSISIHEDIKPASNNGEVGQSSADMES